MKRKEKKKKKKEYYPDRSTTADRGGSPYLPFGILDDGIGVGELLHASGLVAQSPVDEPARLVEDI
jgi:hypothetical protein